MNTIIKKIQADEVKEKREAKRKPLCANLDKVCTFKICRCGYSNILDKKAKSAIKKSIDENIHHKQKVIERKQDIAKMKNDIENEEIIDKDFYPQLPEWYRSKLYKKIYPKCYQGTHAIEKERRAKINRNIWMFILIFMFIILLYMWAIALYDLF